MALVAAWWGIWHIISGFTLAGFWSRRPTPEPLPVGEAGGLRSRTDPPPRIGAMAPPTVTLEHLAAHVTAGWPSPRVVVPGNFATPWAVVDALDAALERWTLHLLNPQPGVPVREG